MKLLVCLAVTGAFLLVPFAWMSTLGTHSDTPSRLQGLAIPEEFLDFGEQTANPSFDWTLPIHNTTDTELTVEITTSCRCARVGSHWSKIPARESRPLQLTLDLTTPAPSNVKEGARSFSVSVTAIVRDDRKSWVQDWHVSGQVIDPLVLSKTRILFAEEMFRFNERNAVASDTIVVHSTTPLLSIRTAAQPDLLDVTSCQQGENEFLVHVSPKQELSHGAISCELQLTGETTDGEFLPEVRIPVEGFVPGTYRIEPDVLSFGPARFGSKREGTASITSRLGHSFRIVEVDCPEEVSIRSVEPSGLLGSVAERHVVNVQQFLNTEGVHSTEVVFVAEDTTGCHDKIALRLNTIAIASGQDSILESSK